MAYSAVRILLFLVSSLCLQAFRPLRFESCGRNRRWHGTRRAMPPAAMASPNQDADSIVWLQGRVGVCTRWPSSHVRCAQHECGHRQPRHQRCLQLGGLRQRLAPVAHLRCGTSAGRHVCRHTCSLMARRLYRMGQPRAAQLLSRLRPRCCHTSLHSSSTAADCIA
jgi:hypothetical protein